ncbi:hypothetical protein [Leptospira interrogans]|nr:hypothetical protein [Leptospira interrogans]ULG78921.1 hypothetical protein FH595_08760 [Leptospira interrogans]ULG92469.1 hypothetical protein FH584_00510 [Leptospira interrogans]UML69647.1 hypothetical protein FH589_05675 [Leptospira interrogans]UML72967.1 hypothetical protein FH598_03905 [Leptospira interrogans]UMQ54258.1 hypothetical protein FH582_20580 [Leptospira interrogans]
METNCKLRGISKDSESGPIVFRLSIESQSNRVLGRIHPDGTFEDPPAKK